jgi:hypothetical protein
MLWDPDSFVSKPDETPYLTLDGPEIDAVPGTVVEQYTVELPLDVRRELQSQGFVDPPTETLWLEVEFDSPPAAEAVEAFVCTDAEENPDRTDSVLLPTRWLERSSSAPAKDET